jgi:hypothetical protein
MSSSGHFCGSSRLTRVARRRRAEQGSNHTLTPFILRPHIERLLRKPVYADAPLFVAGTWPVTVLLKDGLRYTRSARGVVRFWRHAGFLLRLSQGVVFADQRNS